MNAPLVFQILWRLLRPMLSAETIAKISILGGPDAYLPQMVAAGMPLSELPSWMASEKHGLRGGSPGVPLGDYVRALGEDDAPAHLRLPATNQLQLPLLSPHHARLAPFHAPPRGRLQASCCPRSTLTTTRKTRRPSSSRSRVRAPSWLSAQAGGRMTAPRSSRCRRCSRGRR